MEKSPPSPTVHTSPRECDPNFIIIVELIFELNSCKYAAQSFPDPRLRPWFDVAGSRLSAQHDGPKAAVSEEARTRCRSPSPRRMDSLVSIIAVSLTASISSPVGAVNFLISMKPVDLRISFLLRSCSRRIELGEKTSETSSSSPPRSMRCGGTNLSSKLWREASPSLEGESGLTGMEMGSDVPIRDVASLESSS